jgi:hypothetical protein
MKKLTNTEANVLAVALDHMEEHLLDLQVELSELKFTQDRLDAVKTLKAKLL